jgi:hypothetical protein
MRFGSFYLAVVSLATPGLVFAASPAKGPSKDKPSGKKKSKDDRKASDSKKKPSAFDVEPVAGDAEEKTFDYVQDSYFGRILLKFIERKNDVSLMVVKEQKWNTYDDCTDEYHGIAKSTFLKSNVAPILKEGEYKVCAAPADIYDINGAYSLYDDVSVEFDKKLLTMDIECTYKQTGSKRVVKVRRSSKKSGKAIRDPAMWKRLNANEGRAGNVENECHSLLYHFIFIQNALIDKFNSANPNKDASKLKMPEIDARNRTVSKTDPPSSGLGAGYIVLIIFSVFAVLGLSWFGLSKLSQRNKARLANKGQEETLIKKKPKKNKRAVRHDDHV